VTMPCWIGVGVLMPFPGCVVEPPMTPMQAYVFACRLVQSLFTSGFHLTKSVREILFQSRMPWQVVVGRTVAKALQFVAMPFWLGVGVLMPLDGRVVVVLGGEPPITPMQAYVFAHRLLQSAPTAGFHLTKSVREILFQSRMPWQVVVGRTVANALQLVTIPSWIGVGVLIPLRRMSDQDSKHTRWPEMKEIVLTCWERWSWAWRRRSS
jgi:hypothetical protein